MSVTSAAESRTCTTEKNASTPEAYLYAVPPGRAETSCRPLAASCVERAEGGLASRVRQALLTGDNRLKQGVGPDKVRESYEQALQLARQAGIEDRIRPLVEVRLADLERLEAEPPPPARPDA
jgi:hypothetical protein